MFKVEELFSVKERVLNKGKIHAYADVLRKAMGGGK